MDDQTQHPLDPSASQARPRKRKSVSQQSRQPDPARGGSPLSQSTQPLPAETTNASQPVPHLTRQLTTPQPILFSGRGIEIFEYEQERLPRAQRPRRMRRWLRSRSGRIIVPLLALLIGVAGGVSSLLWYGLSGEGPVVIVPSSAQGNLIIEADKDFVTQLIKKDLTSAGLPGQVENVSVDLDHGAKITIQGDDVYPVLGVNLSRHFTVDVQPYVQSCVLQIRVTHADLGGIPVTSFVQAFQGNINNQLAKKPAGLPDNFTYCTVGVRTEPGGMFITYQATALGQ